MRLLTTARVAGINPDAPEGENRFLELGLLDQLGLNPKVFHTGFVEHDGTGIAVPEGRPSGMRQGMRRERCRKETFMVS